MKKYFLICGTVLALGLGARSLPAQTTWAPQGSVFAQHVRARLRRRFSLSPAAPSIRNFGKVEPGVFRGAQPSGAAAYAFLKDSGISIIVNLRYFHSDDQRLCYRYGLSCVQFPLLLLPGQDAFFNWRVLREAFAFTLTQSQAGRTVFIHCKDGSDRTGVLAAALLLRVAALSREQISRAELWRKIRRVMKNFGFHSFFIFLKLRVRDWIFHPASTPWITAPLSAMENSRDPIMPHGSPRMARLRWA